MPGLRIFIQTEAPSEAPSKAPTNPTPAPTNAPTKAPTSAPTKAPTDAPTASYTPVSTSKGQQCPLGYAIDNKVECENDVMTEYDFVGEISKSNRPFGCFLTSRNKKYYNSAPPVKSKVFKHTRAICKGGDDFAPPAPEYTLTGAKKGKNCADGQIVGEEDDCKAAANELGKSFKKSVTSKTRPAGCYFKGGKAWFNTNTAMYAKGRYGKFTGLCNQPT